MRIICSWCRREGKVGLIGEKKPLEDLRETHSICKAHQAKVQARWKDGVYAMERPGRRAASTSVKKTAKHKKAM